MIGGQDAVSSSTGECNIHCIVSISWHHFEFCAWDWKSLMEVFISGSKACTCAAHDSVP